MASYSYITRAVEKYAFDEELTARHMVFLAGPRQVGKTRMAREWLKKKGCSDLYYNWDDIATRQSYLKDSRFFEAPARSLSIEDAWVSFDEIHKRTNWRDILKGAYDIFQDEFRFIITGSARLDLFRKSGDSLVGRYNLFNLMPFNIRELAQLPDQTAFIADSPIPQLSEHFEQAVASRIKPEIIEAWQALLRFGPFPEPLFKQSDRFCRKWHLDYHSLLIREDLRDISRIVELDKIERMLMLIPDRITSPLSMQDLARNIEASHTSVKSWLEQLQKLYMLFPVSPWSQKISRGLKKEKKWYFHDWYYAPEGPARLENLVAASLYRYCLSLTDMGHGNFKLHYIRTLDKREIDFLIVRDNQPLLAIEVKSGASVLSPPLKQRKKWFPDHQTIGIQLVNKRDILHKYPNNTWIMSAEKFLSTLV